MFKAQQVKSSTVSIDEFYRATKSIVDSFNTWYARYGRFSKECKTDHVCFKCASSQEFETLRRLFEIPETSFYQSIHSGRRIAVIQLPKPIITSHGDIWFLELSDQKPDMSQVSGFDHIALFPPTAPCRVVVDLLENREGIEFVYKFHPNDSVYVTNLKGGFKLHLTETSLLNRIRGRERQ